jgi:5-methylcytosine-specific restriction protein B
VLGRWLGRLSLWHTSLAVEYFTQAAWDKLPHYYSLVDSLRNEVLPRYSNIVLLKNSFTNGQDCYQEQAQQILIQDILYVTFSSKQLNDKSESTMDKSSQPNYWLFSPGKQAAQWDEFQKEGIMAIGDDQLGDLKNYKTKGEIEERLKELLSTD